MDDKIKGIALKWDTEVKPQALICSKGFSLMAQIEREKGSNQETIDKLNALGLHDCVAGWYIGEMIWGVEHDLADGRVGLKMINSVFQVQGTLNDASYWTNVWNNDDSSEEAQALRKLASLINELVAVM